PEGYPSGQRGQTVNLLAYAFGGSNPPPSTSSKAVRSRSARWVRTTEGSAGSSTGLPGAIRNAPKARPRRGGGQDARSNPPPPTSSKAVRSRSARWVRTTEGSARSSTGSPGAIRNAPKARPRRGGGQDARGTSVPPHAGSAPGRPGAGVVQW